MIRLPDDPRLTIQSCDAMNTTFCLRLDCSDEGRAKDAVSECFNQLERLEADLSRFRPDSDVSRINGLQPGESLYISEHTHACLLQAAEAQAATEGLFDVTLGSAPGCLVVAPDRPLVTCRGTGGRVDLGGIGKGFALDQLALTIASYRIDSAFLAAGASTLLALGPHGWPVDLIRDQDNERIILQGRALSASGTGIQGAHVVHPDAPGLEPAYAFARVWVEAATAAEADAYSTACLLMAPPEIEAFAALHSDQIRIRLG